MDSAKRPLMDTKRMKFILFFQAVVFPHLGQLDGIWAIGILLSRLFSYQTVPAGHFSSRKAWYKWYPGR